MTKHLKGNYEISKGNKDQDMELSETSTQEFERRAVERLGGSIAFVLKKDTFIWRGDKSARKKTDKKT